MNEYLLLTLLERLLSIYNNSEISLDKQCQFTQEFKAPIAASLSVTPSSCALYLKHRGKVNHSALQIPFNRALT